jgi:hypothetical protein
MEIQTSTYGVSQMVDVLISALTASFAPLVKELDDLFGPANAAQDNGQALPSQKDMGIRITLDSILRQVHRQLYGDMTARTGNKIDNAQERFQKSERQLANILAKYEGDVENAFADPEFDRAHGWLRINEARYNTLLQLHTAFGAVYLSITGEAWKFVDLNSDATTSSSGKRVKVSDAEKADIVARFAKKTA